MPLNESLAVSCFKSSFELFEQLSEATSGWDLDFRQLKRNRKAFSLEQLSTSKLLYSRAAFDSPFYQLGGPSAGFRTFALQAEESTDFRWCNEHVSRQNLIVFPVGGDFECNSQPGFNIYTLSLNETLLEEVAQAYCQRPLSDFIGSGREVCFCDPGSILSLRATLHTLSHSIGCWSDMPLGPPKGVRWDALEEKLALLILQCLQGAKRTAGDKKLSKRLRALNQVLSLIENTPLQSLNLADMLTQVDVSRRTVELAFQDRFSVSPASYIKSLRLQALNSTLLHAHRSENLVSELSVAHGFSHLGQLAIDYRDLFGELPSTTLRRSVAL